MKIFKKLLPVLLAAVLLTGAIAAFSACAPIEPNIPPEEEEPWGLHNDKGPAVLGLRVPNSILFREVIYKKGDFQDNAILIDQWIGVLCNAEDYDTCRAKYPDKEIAVDPENELINKINGSGDICFLYSAEGYPEEEYILVCGEKDGGFDYLYIKEEME